MTATTAETLRAERELLVQRLRPLADDDWDRASLCAGWTIRHVVAHLVTPFTVSAPAMAVAIARSGSISAAMDTTARRIAARRDPEQLLRTLELSASSTFRPPGLPLAAPLTDAVAHSADIRWALGDPVEDWSSPSRLRPVLGFLTSARARAGFVPAGRLRGVELVAEDQDWRSGRGAVVRGPSLVLVMTVLGRLPARAPLAGDGPRLLTRAPT